jgi:hypothetical protein
MSRTNRTFTLIGVLLAASFALLLAPPVASVAHAKTVMLICSAAFSAAFLYFLAQRGSRPETQIELDVRRTHFVQAIAQGSIYFFVGAYYPGVAQWAPYVIYQLIFAFTFDFLLSIYRHNRYKLGFSIFPIVLSINLFIWFKPEYFVGQLIMIMIAILAKAYIVRTVDGRTRHIFNPSALPMAITTVLFVLLLNAEYMLNTNNVVTSYLLPPHFQLFVFVMGMFSHLAGRVSFISLGAVATLYIIDTVFTAIMGLPPMGDILQPSVFIGITLLVTDPVTSPKTRLGQLIYGSLYGILIVIGYVTLNHFGYPRYYDKILPVPILNYLAPYIDRIRAPRWRPFQHPVWQTAWAPAAVYAVIFVALLPAIERAFLRRTYFIEVRASFSRDASRRQPIDPQLAVLVQRRIAERCDEDPTLEACRLLGPPGSRGG